MPAGPVVTRSLHGACAGGRLTLIGASEASGNSIRHSSSRTVCSCGCLVVTRGSRATAGDRVNRLSSNRNFPNRNMQLSLIADTKARTTSQQQLPPELIRARRFKATGFGASAAVLGVGLGTAWVQGVPLPSLGPWSFVGSASLIPVGAVVLLLAITRDKAQIEVHKGRLYIQWGSPSTGAPLADGSIEVINESEPLKTCLCSVYSVAPAKVDQIGVDVPTLMQTSSGAVVGCMHDSRATASHAFLLESVAPPC